MVKKHKYYNRCSVALRLNRKKGWPKRKRSIWIRKKFIGTKKIFCFRPHFSLFTARKISFIRKGFKKSYLSSITNRSPRRYSYPFFGREIRLRYFTIPFRLPMASAVGNWCLRSYYSGLKHKKLSKLIKSSRSKIQNDKHILSLLESRIDSSLLRILNFKSLYINRRRYRLKNPLSFFSMNRAQQFISHGKIFLSTQNGAHKKVKAGSSIEKNNIYEMTICSPNTFHKRGQLDRAARNFNFSKIFYAIYKNMHIFQKTITPAKSYGYRISNTENEINNTYNMMRYHSMYLLWPTLSLLKVSSWSSTRSLILSKRFKKQNKKRLLQLRRLLRWKRLNMGKNIPNIALNTHNQEPSLIYNRPSKCYASIAYGTRRCKWIKSFQKYKGSFYHSFHHRINFFETELEYFQLIYQYYSNRKA